MKQLPFHLKLLSATIALSSVLTIGVSKSAFAQTFVGTTQLYVGADDLGNIFDQTTPISTAEEELTDTSNGQFGSVSGAVGDDSVAASATASGGGIAIIDQSFFDTISATNLALTGTTIDLNAYISVGDPITNVTSNGSYTINETLSISNNAIQFGPSENLSYLQSYDSLYGLYTYSDTSGSIPIIVGDKYTVDLELDVRAGSAEAGDFASVTDDPGFYFHNIPDDLTITSSSGAPYTAPAAAPEATTWALMSILMVLGCAATVCNRRRTQSLSADQRIFCDN